MYIGLNSQVLWMTRCLISHICCSTGCISSPSPMSVTFMGISRRSLTNSSSEVQTFLQCFVIFQSLLNWCRKLNVQGPRLHRLSIWMRNVSQFMHQSRALHHLPLRSAMLSSYISKCHGILLWVGLQGIDREHFLELKNENKSAHNLLMLRVIPVGCIIDMDGSENRGASGGYFGPSGFFRLREGL